MFNFATTEDGDIGVYGSVFLFSTYLEKLAGEGVFRNFHNYWRFSRSSTLDDAEALYNSIPEAEADRIKNEYAYIGDIKFATNEQEWMSKLVLDFYMSLLKKADGSPASYAEVENQFLLYDEIIKVNLSLYDTDGLEGLYVPSSSFRETARDVASGAVGSSMSIGQGSYGNSLSQWGMQAVQNAYQRTTSAVGKVIRKNTAHLKYGTFVYLVNGNQTRTE